jgi:hypothetical protein
MSSLRAISLPDLRWNAGCEGIRPTGEIMNLGKYGSYPLPAGVRRSFGVDTAGQLADQLGVKGEITDDLAREAETAYSAYNRGDLQAVRQFLTTKLGVADDVADDAIAKLAAS